MKQSFMQLAVIGQLGRMAALFIGYRLNISSRKDLTTGYGSNVWTIYNNIYQMVMILLAHLDKLGFKILNFYNKDEM